MEYPHSPAAFINVIAESGTKEEAVKYLQETWNELVWLRAQRVNAVNNALFGHWISVKDELPQQGEVVVALEDAFIGDGSGWYRAWVVDGVWHLDNMGDDGSDDTSDAITHWMRVPMEL